MDETSRLILFADVIDSGSFSKAARRRDVNRSMVSKQIAQLETQLELRLLNRTTRSLSLTDAGHAIYQHACRLRDQLMETDALVDSLREEIQGVLRISSTTHFGRRHVMPVVKTMAEDYPELKFDLQLEDRYVDIVAERYDVAIRITTPVDSSLIARKLTNNRLVMVASPGYLHQHGTPHTINDLQHHRFIVYGGEQGVMNSWAWHDGSEIKNISVNVHTKVNDGYALLKSAQNGIGIGLTLLSESSTELNNGTLVEVLPNIAFKAFSSTYLMYPSRSHMPKKTQLFIERMMAYVKQQDFYIQ
ncbi:MAG TPA: LysR family transcriptional regulator [Gammaproteobacteria bacterium]|nr:LysR family transcriptional regulator [Gammaproteobacteria bacterium]